MFMKKLFSLLNSSINIHSHAETVCYLGWQGKGRFSSCCLLLWMVQSMGCRNTGKISSNVVLVMLLGNARCAPGNVLSFSASA